MEHLLNAQHSGDMVTRRTDSLWQPASKMAPKAPCLLVHTPSSRPLCATDGIWQSDDRPLARSDCSKSCCSFVWVSLSVTALL